MGLKKIENVQVPWSRAIVMVCGKCGRKLGDEDLSNDLKKELKAKIKSENLGGDIRVVTSSCLDICPKYRIAIAVADGDDLRFRAIAVDPNTSPDEIFDALKLPSKSGNR